MTSKWFKFRLTFVLLTRTPVLTNGGLLERSLSMNTEVIASGLAVSTNHGHINRTQDSLCMCRTSCYTWPQCMSFSYEKRTKDCRLLTEGPITNTEDNPDAVYHYIYLTDVAAEPESKIVRGSDGLYYFYLQQTFSFGQAKAYCESLPGFHLPIIITQAHFDVLSNSPVAPENGFFLDLHIDESGAYMWSNGLEFTSTTQVNLQKQTIENDYFANKLYTIFHLYKGGFHDCSTSWSLKLACQANLDNVPWN
ncbi:PAN/Apple domain [Trinorchestia longiramus]|nr:PAN/Apple domain [Trinorchestia longiramus]